MNKLNSFTIIEVLVTISIMTIVITIFSSLINKFNLQLSVNQNINEQIRGFMIFRANLRNECYNADSIIINGDTLQIFNNVSTINYFKQNELLYRNTSLNRKSNNLEIEIVSIFKGNVRSRDTFFMNLILGGHPITLRLETQNNLKSIIDNFFLND